jgi:hypothetical protein
MPVHKPYRGNDAGKMAFDKRNGVSIFVSNENSDSGWHRYANGALRESSHYGGIFEPPADSAERQKLIIIYHECYTEQAKREFDYHKSKFMREAHILGDSQILEAERDLKARRKLVKQGRKELKAAKLELLRIQMNVETVEEALKLQEERKQRSAESAFERSQEQAKRISRISNIRV